MFLRMSFAIFTETLHSDGFFSMRDLGYNVLLGKIRLWPLADCENDYT
jgi:hypothetical protein